MALTIVASLGARTGRQADGTVYGIAFYNLENLFDTINSNGKSTISPTP